METTTQLDQGYADGDVNSVLEQILQCHLLHDVLMRGGIFVKTLRMGHAKRR